MQAAEFAFCLLAQLSIQPKVKLRQLRPVLADPLLILKNESCVHFSGQLHLKVALVVQHTIFQ